MADLFHEKVLSLMDILIVFCFAAMPHAIS